MQLTKPLPVFTNNIMLKKQKLVVVIVGVANVRIFSRLKQHDLQVAMYNKNSLTIFSRAWCLSYLTVFD